MDYTEALRLLRVSRGASPSEIKEAYLDLAKVWHPDRFGQDPRLRAKAEEALKQINQAYQLLQRAGASRARTSPPGRNRAPEPDAAPPPPSPRDRTRRPGQGASRPTSRPASPPGPPLFTDFWLKVVGVTVTTVWVALMAAMFLRESHRTREQTPQPSGNDAAVTTLSAEGTLAGAGKQLQQPQSRRASEMRQSAPVARAQPPAPARGSLSVPANAAAPPAAPHTGPACHTDGVRFEPAVMPRAAGAYAWSNPERVVQPVAHLEGVILLRATRRTGDWLVVSFEDANRNGRSAYVRCSEVEVFRQ